MKSFLLVHHFLIFLLMFTLLPLPYDYNALEPHIDEETMRLHHQKHHQGYVNKANQALEDHPVWLEKTPEDVLRQLSHVPQEVRTAVQNHVGGVSNHNFFWESMSPQGGGTPQGDLLKALEKEFGSFENFKKEFSLAAASVFGSGWAWLVSDADKNVKIVATSNQDSPLSQGTDKILLALDVWEHAYYLHYQNRRPDYIEAFWNVVNWEKAQNRYEG